MIVLLVVWTDFHSSSAYRQLVCFSPFWWTVQNYKCGRDLCGDTYFLTSTIVFCVITSSSEFTIVHSATWSQRFHTAVGFEIKQWDLSLSRLLVLEESFSILLQVLQVEIGFAGFDQPNESDWDIFRSNKHWQNDRSYSVMPNRLRRTGICLLAHLIYSWSAASHLINSCLSASQLIYSLLSHQRLKLFFLPIFMIFLNVAPVRLQRRN